MNFFEHQDRSRTRTRRLIVLFALGVAAIIAAVYAAVVIIMGFSSAAEPGSARMVWYNPGLFAWVALACLTVISCGSLIKWIALRQGGPAVAESLGGREIIPGAADARERVLVNVVEEMALASGVPVPAIYVLDQEAGINAFAAGYSSEDAVVAVTRGCLEQLSRDELQGVVAHEFSHILNGDMRLNIRLIALIGGILVLAVIGRIMLRSDRRGARDKNSGPVVMLGLALFLIGYIGVFVTRIIQSAVCRQREYLSDASAVQFTRNPRGIAGALKKIGGCAAGSSVASPMASETGHMFFGKAFSSIFATHPPLGERISRIETGYKAEPAARQAIPSRDLRGASSPPGAAVSGFASYPAPGAFLQNAGTLTEAAVAISVHMLQSVPAQIRTELYDPFGASCVMYGLLLDRNDHLKDKQLQALAAALPAEVLQRVARLHAIIAGLAPDMILALLDLSLPALRNLSPRQYAQFKQHVRTLVEADGTISLFEFTVQQILLHRLDAAFNRSAGREVFRSIGQLLDDAVIIISKISAEGNADPAQARQAFKAGMGRIPVSEAHDACPLDVSLEAVGSALSKFAASRPAVKRVLLEACAHCVLHDRQVSPSEAVLLRAVAYALDVPVPPMAAEPFNTGPAKSR
ncbi:MAG: M48 family metallopeptidase [Deltaproteobacteria bacterium]|nr:M48 family metallopeptidase [Deltaproteobacteria bacterium]